MEDVRSTPDWMGSKSIFSTFDVKDGFFQVSLAEGSRDYTAIRTVIGLLRYVRLPQGLKNSPAVFQRVVNAILGSRKGRDVWAFMDDISMGTQTAEAHLLCLKSVLDTFIAAGARLKLSKCAFGGAGGRGTGTSDWGTGDKILRSACAGHPRPSPTSKW